MRRLDRKVCQVCDLKCGSRYNFFCFFSCTYILTHSCRNGQHCDLEVQILIIARDATWVSVGLYGQHILGNLLLQLNIVQLKQIFALRLEWDLLFHEQIDMENVRNPSDISKSRFSRNIRHCDSSNVKIHEFEKKSEKIQIKYVEFWYPLFSSIFIRE